MQNVIYLLLRRMRLPLIVLIATYSISILGLVLIPGIDPQGNPWRMDFFHATYFVSFLGSTIGFGEIPYPFTAAQRMWTLLIIYAAVFSWLYAIGSILTLIQDPAVRRVLSWSLFSRKVRARQEPFYLICGYGDAGSWLVRELTERGFHCVVIEADQSKILGLQVEDLHDDVPGLGADATDAGALLAAGLKHPACRGVVCLTGEDHANLTIAITSKLLAPDVPVICQSDTHDAADNMASFGTDHVVDPFLIFASRFAMLFHSPSMYLIYEWMTAVHNAPLTEHKKPPAGTWILCGFGRFGKAVRHYLSLEGIETRVVEADIDLTQAPPDTVEGRGTEADTLLEAGVKEAAGIIAGTDNDSNNLSILITARDLNPELFTAARQNHRRNDAIFKAADIDLIMQPETIAAQHILGLILAPLLDDFLRLANEKDEQWANVLVSRVAGVVDECAPETWDFAISPQQTPAVFQCLFREHEVTLGHICSDPSDQSHSLRCVPLLLKRDDTCHLLPDNDQRLSDGDRLLFCGRKDAKEHMDYVLHDCQALDYVRTGIDRPSGVIWRWLTLKS
jgi:voltage-gated potassium channel